ncbi:hypothetical protein ACQCVK_02870 [Rossellomorea vietnamensis]|uniref:hypothetical protein n=1 Tax=Rossellomorea vietnamensis TaxID=218284 RepID=UPI003CEC493D
MTNIYTHVNVVKEEKIKPKAERKLDGLTRRKKQQQTKINYVLQIERLWEKYKLCFDNTEKAQRLNTLIKQLSLPIKRKAEALGAQWNNKRISASDFESIFYEELWKLCDTYNHYGDFYFYETLLLVLERRGTDLIRKRTRTKQGIFECEIRRLREDAADYIADPETDIEGDTINGLLAAQILNDTALTDRERSLLIAKYENPDLSKAELAGIAGLKHHQEVSRLFVKVQKKLASYKC